MQMKAICAPAARPQRIALQANYAKKAQTAESSDFFINAVNIRVFLLVFILDFCSISNPVITQFI